ncbi:MAG: hypothetical protein ACYTFI_13035, partial [Planctomycetota bacterium]
MKQRTHSWIAVRAIALLEKEKKWAKLVKLLKPHARLATVGAWIPDMQDAKRGGGGCAIDNHVLKIKPYEPKNEKEDVSRFVATKADLLGRVGLHRKMAGFIKKDEELSDTWWEAAYKGDVNRPGQHLPNRAMGMATMMMDLLLNGNKLIEKLLPGAVSYLKSLDANARTHDAAASLYFFMLSHFVADICMPCHSDARKLSSYEGGFPKKKKGKKKSKKKKKPPTPLHKGWEARWNTKIGTGFEKSKLLKSKATPDEVLGMARGIDEKFGLEFSLDHVPPLPEDTDVWLDGINLCRLSFAVVSSIVPPVDYPYGKSNARITFDKVFGPDRQDILEELDAAILHDAVLNTATV